MVSANHSAAKEDVQLCFIVPVRHPGVSNSYRRVLELLTTTLKSITHQTSGSFQVIVVMSEGQDVLPSHDRVEYLQVDYSCPNPSATDGHSWVYIDKGCRVGSGLIRAHQYNANYVMVVDSDDFVSDKLVSFVAQSEEVAGWYFPRGLRYSSKTRKLNLLDKFWSYCGTSHVIGTEYLEVPAGLGSDSSKRKWLETAGVTFVKDILGNHLKYQQYVTSFGEKLRPLPFVGAAWHLDTGENASRLESYGQKGPIWGPDAWSETGLVREFGFPAEKRTKYNEVVLRARQVKNIVGRLVRSGCGFLPN